MGAGEPRTQASWHACNMHTREATWGVAPREAAPRLVRKKWGEAGGGRVVGGRSLTNTSRPASRSPEQCGTTPGRAAIKPHAAGLHLHHCSHQFQNPIKTVCVFLAPGFDRFSNGFAKPEIWVWARFEAGLTECQTPARKISWPTKGGCVLMRRSAPGPCHSFESTLLAKTHQSHGPVP